MSSSNSRKIPVAPPYYHLCGSSCNHGPVACSMVPGMVQVVNAPGLRTPAARCSICDYTIELCELPSLTCQNMTAQCLAFSVGGLFPAQISGFEPFERVQTNQITRAYSTHFCALFDACTNPEGRKGVVCTNPNCRTFFPLRLNALFVFDQLTTNMPLQFIGNVISVRDVGFNTYNIRNSAVRVVQPVVRGFLGRRCQVRPTMLLQHLLQHHLQRQHRHLKKRAFQRWRELVGHHKHLQHRHRSATTIVRIWIGFVVRKRLANLNKIQPWILCWLTKRHMQARTIQLWIRRTKAKHMRTERLRRVHRWILQRWKPVLKRCRNRRKQRRKREAKRAKKKHLQHLRQQQNVELNTQHVQVQVQSNKAIVFTDEDSGGGGVKMEDPMDIHLDPNVKTVLPMMSREMVMLVAHTTAYLTGYATKKHSPEMDPQMTSMYGMLYTYLMVLPSHHSLYMSGKAMFPPYSATPGLVDYFMASVIKAGCNENPKRNKEYVWCQNERHMVVPFHINVVNDDQPITVYIPMKLLDAMRTTHTGDQVPEISATQACRLGVYYMYRIMEAAMMTGYSQGISVPQLGAVLLCSPPTTEIRMTDGILNPSILSIAAVALPPTLRELIITYIEHSIPLFSIHQAMPKLACIPIRCVFEIAKVRDLHQSGDIFAGSALATQHADVLSYGRFLLDDFLNLVTDAGTGVSSFSRSIHIGQQFINGAAELIPEFTQDLMLHRAMVAHQIGKKLGVAITNSNMVKLEIGLAANIRQVDFPKGIIDITTAMAETREASPKVMFARVHSMYIKLVAAIEVGNYSRGRVSSEPFMPTPDNLTGVLVLARTGILKRAKMALQHHVVAGDMIDQLTDVVTAVPFHLDDISQTPIADGPHNPEKVKKILSRVMAFAKFRKLAARFRVAMTTFSKQTSTPVVVRELDTLDIETSDIQDIRDIPEYQMSESVKRRAAVMLSRQRLVMSAAMGLQVFMRILAGEYTIQSTNQMMNMLSYIIKAFKSGITELHMAIKWFQSEGGDGFTKGDLNPHPATIMLRGLFLDVNFKSQLVTPIQRTHFDAGQSIHGIMAEMHI